MRGEDERMSARGGKKKARVGVDAEGGKHEWHENTIFPPPWPIHWIFRHT